ncbi:hypothetical protein [Dyella silvatica]|uniref:hypothetical protein n=1 Tax=Dyella silvatica TaxID=2992128 RepID=UPI0022590467|nr:hypothetical protein [Dyella silvatica]
MSAVIGYAMAIRESMAAVERSRLAWAYVACFALLLGGCRSPSEESLDKVFGINAENVVLAKDQFQLRAEPTAFPFDRPLTLLGRKSSVCFVLRSGAIDVHNMDAMFDQALQGAHIQVHLSTSDGRSLDRPASAEVLYMKGKITGANELCACASIPLGHALPGKTHIESIAASSAEPVLVFGVYWKSRDKTD